MISGAWQTPVADWLARGLNLCNSLVINPLLRPYASASGPLFGGPSFSDAKGFFPSCRADAQPAASL